MFWALLLYVWIIPKITVGQIYVDSTDDVTSFGLHRLNLDSLHLTLSSRILLDVNFPGQQSLSGYLGCLPKDINITYTSCGSAESTSDAVCLRHGKSMKVKIIRDESDSCNSEFSTCHNVECHRIEWINRIGGAYDCFNLGEVDWYGGSELAYQRWPLEGNSISFVPAATGDPLHHPSGNVVENLWITSSGYVVFVDHSVPLFVSFNDSGNSKLCFSTSSKKPPYQSDHGEKRGLKYTICSAGSVKNAYQYSLHRWIDKPEDTPEEAMFQYPVWSTWARYKRNIDQGIIIKFAEEIQDAGFPSGQLQIDDKWEDCYGNLAFDQNKFPNPNEVTQYLLQIGFYVTLWVHPFCNKECACFSEGERKGFWVKDVEGKTLEVKWWNGDSASVLDTTNPEAADWFSEKLRTLQTKYDITSFKFDAGEVLWLSKGFVLHDPEANLQPNLYSKAYVNIAERFGRRVEVRTGYESQNLPIFTRMFDKFSRWDFANGLRTLIPTALQLSLMGYFFPLPDMVGGNNYDSLNGSLPDRELYIRWLQASVFMPVIQFSIVPWDYDAEVVKISKKMVDLHEKYYSHLTEAATDSVTLGKPMIRPLWWIAPDDPEALRCDSQFLVGEEIMVAPVLTKGKYHRHIYLPDGKWADVQRGKIYEGAQWLFSYEAPLSFLPFFVRHN